MKIRIEGTEKEIKQLIENLPVKYQKGQISKFYPNTKQRSTLPVFGTAVLGRVYLEVE